MAIYDSPSIPTRTTLWEVNGNQGDEWKTALIDININNRQPNVKIQVEIIAKGRNTYSDIAIDDLHLTKGVCDRTPGKQTIPRDTCQDCLQTVTPCISISLRYMHNNLAQS